VEDAFFDGDYTVMVSESQRGSLESMVLKVGTTDIQSIGETIAGVQGQVSQAASAASAARDIVESVRAELGAEGQEETAYQMISDLRTALETIKKSITEVPQGLNVEPMHARIREINELLKQISSENGINLDVMYQSVDETTNDVNELQDKVERLNVLINVNREIAEKLLERSPPKKAVIKTWFETGT